MRLFGYGAPLLLSVGCAAPALQDAASDATYRLHSTTALLEEGTDHRTLVRGEYKGLEAGYIQRDEGAGQAWGVKIPAGKILSQRKDVDADVLLYGFDEEHEVVLAVRPEPTTEVVQRAFDFEEDGYAVFGHWRNHADFETAGNYGAGVGLALEGGEVDPEAYAWMGSEELGGLFVGIGMYTQDNRLVVGHPNTGGPAWRYVGMFREENELHEFLFSTQGKYLRWRDAYSVLNGRKASDSLHPDGFLNYQNPPILLRGEGVTGGIVHRGFDENDSVRGVIGFSDGSLMVGGTYTDTDVHMEGNEFWGLQAGHWFPEGDGGTRNGVVVESRYNPDSGEWELLGTLELKIPGKD